MICQKKITSYFRAMRISLIIVPLLFVFVACQDQGRHEPLTVAVNESISKIKNEYAPDGRVAIFNIEALEQQERIILKGKTDLPAAKRTLLEHLTAQEVPLIDSIEVLPAAQLAGKVRGVINNSVANIRSAPRHSGELATQALLGTPVKVLDVEGEWYQVQTPDDYISWVDHGGLVLMDDEAFSAWQSTPKMIYHDVSGYSYRSVHEEAIVSDLVMGAVLALEGDLGSYYEVAYPDGRKAVIRKKEAAPLPEWMDDDKKNTADLVNNGMKLMGSPYLWGGTSTKGMDCSGFTKSLYLMEGLVIPRDASQQVHAGLLIDEQKDWSLLAPGDLLFFGTPMTEQKKERVVHVGMWIGNNSFIHASQQVRISSVDPSSPLYDAFNVDRYLRTRRYLGAMQGNIIDLSASNIYQLTDY